MKKSTNSEKTNWKTGEVTWAIPDQLSTLQSPLQFRTVLIPICLLKHFSSLPKESKFHINLLRFLCLARMLDKEGSGKVLIKDLVKKGPTLLGLSKEVFKQYLKRCDNLFFKRFENTIYYKSTSRILTELEVDVSDQRCIEIDVFSLSSISSFRAYIHTNICQLLNGITKENVTKRLLAEEKGKKPLKLYSRKKIGEYTGLHSTETALRYEKITCVEKETVYKTIHTSIKSLNLAIEWLSWTNNKNAYRGLIRKTKKKGKIYYDIAIILGIRYDPLEHKISKTRRRRIFQKWNKNEVSTPLKQQGRGSTKKNSVSYFSSITLPKNVCMYAIFQYNRILARYKGNKKKAYKEILSKDSNTSFHLLNAFNYLYTPAQPIQS